MEGLLPQLLLPPPSGVTTKMLLLLFPGEEEVDDDKGSSAAGGGGAVVVEVEEEEAVVGGGPGSSVMDLIALSCASHSATSATSPRPRSTATRLSSAILAADAAASAGEGREVLPPEP